MQKARSHLIDDSLRGRLDGKGAAFAAHVIEGLCDAAPKVGGLAVGMAATLFATGGDKAALTVAGFALAQAAAAVVAVHVRMRSEALAEEVFDMRGVHQTVLNLEARAKDLFATRRGTAWLVTSPDSDAPTVMDDRGYQELKRSVAERGGALDEVVVTHRAIDVRRYVGDKLDAGDRPMPAIERYDIALERRSLLGWFQGGRKVEAEAVVRRSEARGWTRGDYSPTQFLRRGVGRVEPDEPLASFSP